MAYTTDMNGHSASDQLRELTARIKRQPELTESMGPVYLLTVPGRNSGQMRSTPVSPLTHDGARWLVAAVAAADWVKNLRASGWGTLTKGTRTERITTQEVSPQERAPVLRAYFQQPFVAESGAFDLSPDAPIEAFAAAAARFPVFKVVSSAVPPSPQVG
jgi:deazaflavin-dependent oxidoreductase (nitroreductase family)